MKVFIGLPTYDVREEFLKVFKKGQEKPVLHVVISLKRKIRMKC